MTPITLSNLTGYTLLILVSIFIDPRGKGTSPWLKGSTYRLLMLSTLKMLVAFSPFLLVSIIKGYNLSFGTGFHGLSLSRSLVWQALLATVGFIIIAIAWMSLIPRLPSVFGSKNIESKQKELMAILPKHRVTLTATFALISFEAGFLEEVYFRGIILTNALHYASPICAILVAAILFGFAHLYQGFWGIIGTFLLGLWLGFSYLLTGNLLVPIIAHFLGDFTCMLIGSRELVNRREV